MCDRTLVSGEVRVLGGRDYCPTHYERATRENPAAALPLTVYVGGVVLFAALVAGLSALTEASLSGVDLVLAGVVIALVPALIWLLAFVRQDRLEPEPKHYVFGVFVLGAILAEAIAQPMLRDFYRIQDWLYASPLVGIVGSILVVGFLQEFLKYAGIRYTVYNSTEFDERVDGIIYGAAIGLGFATMLNLRYVIGNNGVDLGVAAIQVSVTALAHASFSGLVGYFLGRAKFERMGPFWLPMGLALAAILNGVVSYSTEVITLDLFEHTPWYGLALTTAVTAAVFAILFVQMRRLNAATAAARRQS